MIREAVSKIQTIEGVIRRRILLNYAVDPEVVQRHLPAPFRPKIYNGAAVAGVCLIRLEGIRPQWMPVKAGMSSENAAHRVAVEWTDDYGQVVEGVYIARRDTGSRLNHLAGGRLFPGTHHMARFNVNDSGDAISFKMDSRDGETCLDLQVKNAEAISAGSIFQSVEDASAFFEGGCDGFSPGATQGQVDGMRLCIGNWAVEPLEIEYVRSAWYDNLEDYPAGSIRLDHALVMRGIEHKWQPIGAPNPADV